jgi:predicted GNAT family acetyltransferase
MELINNTAKNRLELHIDGYVAFEDYKIQDDYISYLHTEVPAALGGKGVGSTLAKMILDYAAEQHLKVKPFCPFIKAYIDKHPDYQANSVFHNPDLQ